ncbi:MAG: hypothetical protein LH617_09030 [Ramlibacter sp.]|nr:hypothetical protein [Ramlibacter sp.]
MSALGPPSAQAGPWLMEAFLLATSAMRLALGYSPHRQQLLAARVLLDDRLAEMATGEGKTAAIALAAAVAALGRTPVHVVTANDYLAQRDAQQLRAFFGLLQLRVDCVTQPMDAAARRRAYGRHVTYCTAKELAFDYLRDGLARTGDQSALEQRARRAGAGPGVLTQAPVLRGLCMAIIDEADTVLIDEARVPLVLAQDDAVAGEGEFYQAALALARRLAPQQDYQGDADGKRFVLTAAGRARLSQWPVAAHPLLGHRSHREATVELALAALLALQRDHDYVVRAEGVLLIDETTGRAAVGRAWSRGLHQLVELKEGVAATRRNSTVNQITFQRFFPRYLRLAGASGTLAEAAGEFRQVYRLGVVRIPPRTAPRVTRSPARLYGDSAGLWQAVADEAATVAATGRPVLIGTGTVAQSQALSQVLQGRGLPHQVLNARQDQGESELIGQAGRAGAITVATSMAGRGTDIVLEPSVVDRGGLHVILCQLNASARIDRQFLGRAGRQGQPGSTAVMIAADFPLLQQWCPRYWMETLLRFGGPPVLLGATVRLVQTAESLTQKKQRVTLCHVAEAEHRELTFSRQMHHEK